MKETTTRVLRTLLDADSSVRPDQRAAALAVLSDRIPEQCAPLLLRQREVARLLSISRSSVYRLMKRGALPVVTIGGVQRYPRKAVESMARDGTPMG